MAASRLRRDWIGHLISPTLESIPWKEVVLHQINESADKKGKRKGGDQPMTFEHIGWRRESGSKGNRPHHHQGHHASNAAILAAGVSCSPREVLVTCRGTCDLWTLGTISLPSCLIAPSPLAQQSVCSVAPSSAIILQRRVLGCG